MNHPPVSLTTSKSSMSSSTSSRKASSFSTDADVTNKAISHNVTPQEIAPDFFTLPGSHAKLLNFQNVKKGDLVGEGAFAKVYRGMYAGRVVAIKELYNAKDGVTLDQLSASNSPIWRVFRTFRREAFIMSELKHPNIVELIGFSVSPVTLVMEYVTGGDLQLILDRRSRIILLDDSLAFEKEELIFIENEVDTSLILEKSDGTRFRVPVSANYETTRQPISNASISWLLRLKIACDIASGMAYLHSLDPPLSHRDLRSPNVCVTSLDPDSPVVAKIMDFGLGDFLSVKTRQRLQTWQWVPPEVMIQDEDEFNVPLYGVSSDVYSFGIVLNEIASRRCPFIDDYWDTHCTSDRLMWRSSFSCRDLIISQGLRPIIQPSTPSRFAELIRSCWEENPLRRPPFNKILSHLKRHWKEISNHPVESDDSLLVPPPSRDSRTLQTSADIAKATQIENLMEAIQQQNSPSLFSRSSQSFCILIDPPSPSSKSSRQNPHPRPSIRPLKRQMNFRRNLRGDGSDSPTITPKTPEMEKSRYSPKSGRREKFLEVSIAAGRKRDSMKALRAEERKGVILYRCSGLVPFPGHSQDVVLFGAVSGRILSLSLSLANMTAIKTENVMTFGVRPVPLVVFLPLESPFCLFLSSDGCLEIWNIHRRFLMHKNPLRSQVYVYADLIVGLPETFVTRDADDEDFRNGRVLLAVTRDGIFDWWIIRLTAPYVTHVYSFRVDFPVFRFSYTIEYNVVGSLSAANMTLWVGTVGNLVCIPIPHLKSDSNVTTLHLDRVIHSDITNVMKTSDQNQVWCYSERGDEVYVYDGRERELLTGIGTRGGISFVHLSTQFGWIFSTLGAVTIVRIRDHSKVATLPVGSLSSGPIIAAFPYQEKIGLDSVMVVTAEGVILSLSLRNCSHGLDITMLGSASLPSVRDSQSLQSLSLDLTPMRERSATDVLI